MILKITLNNKEVMTIKMAAKKLGVTVQTLYASVKSGRVKSIKHDSTIYLDASDIKSIKKYARVSKK